MFVCICKGIKDSDIREAVDNGANTLSDVANQLGVASQCGKCACLASEVISDALATSDASAGGPQYYGVA